MTQETPNPVQRTGYALAVFVKTPGLSPVKSRLSETIGKDEATRFYHLSCACLGALLKQVSIQSQSSSEQVIPYWAVAEQQGLKNPNWKDFDRVAQGEGEMGRRISKVYDELISRHKGVLFISADSPHIPPELVDQSLQLLNSSERFLLGPAEDGGLYLFGGNREVPQAVWTSIPYNDWQTAELLTKGLSVLAPVKKMPIQFDVDSTDDLLRLKKMLGSRKDISSEQKALLNWLGRV